MDYYQRLEVAATATEAEIKKAYRRLAMKYHPDRNPGDKDAEATFKKIQEAYGTLGDSLKRSEYDRRRGFFHETTPPEEDRDEDFVHKPRREEYGGFSASRRYTATKEELEAVQCQFFGGGSLQGRNVLIHVMVSKEELATGTTRSVRWKKRDKCKPCDGYGTANLKDAEFVQCKACQGTGNVMKIPGKQGMRFPRCTHCDGAGFEDTHCRHCKGTGLWDMVIEEMMVDIPAGTPGGHQIVVRGRGEYAKGGVAGNLHIVVIESS